MKVIPGFLPLVWLGVTLSSVGFAQDAFEPDNSPNQANVISTGAAQNRSIHAVGDVDWVRFTLTDSSTVVIETNGDSGDTEMWLYGPNSPTKEIAYNDDGSRSPFFSRIERRGTDALAPGTYYLKIGALGNESAIEAYTLSLVVTPESDLGVGADVFEPDDTSPQAKSISPGSTQKRSLNRPGDVDWVKFTLTKQSAVRIETDGESGDTQMWLYGPDSPTRQIAYDDDGGGRPFFSRIERQGAGNLSPGTYFIKIDEVDNDSTIASYTLRLSATPVSASSDRYEPDDSATTAKEILSSSAQSRSIYPVGDVDWAAFTLSVPSFVRIETSGSAGNTRMWLYGPNDPSIEIGFDDDGGSGEFSLIDRSTGSGLAAGTYWIEIADWGDNDVIDPYTLSVTATPVAASARPVIESVSAISNQITFAWSSVAGKSYRVESSRSLGSDVQWTEVSGSLKANSSRVTTSVDRIPGATQSFYRIVEE